MTTLTLTAAIVLAALSAPAFAASMKPYSDVPARAVSAQAPAPMNAFAGMPVAPADAYRYQGGPKADD